MDVPVVDYDYEDRNTHSKKKMDALADEWNKKRKDSPFKKGYKINLNDYLQNKL